MRALDLTDHDIDRPARPVAPAEPVPEFTRMFHSYARWCGNPHVRGTNGNGHLYTYMPYANRVAAWHDNQLYGDRTLTLAWVENTPPCPHCERDAWALQCRQVSDKQREHDRAEAERERLKAGTWKKPRKRGIAV